MKNNIIIDIEDGRNPTVRLGKVNNLAIDTDGLPPYLSDLNTILNGLIIQMRVCEQKGVNITDLMNQVDHIIKEGMFDAKLIIKLPCAEK